MNTLDWILTFAGAFWVLRGVMRGAVSQILGIAAIVVSFYLASHRYQLVGVFIKKQLPSISTTVLMPLSFILLFLLTWFVIAVVCHWIVMLLHTAGLGFLDRLWGAMIGFAKAFLFAIIVISALILFSPGENPTLVARSKIAPLVMKASQLYFKLAPPKVQEKLAEKQKEARKLFDSLLSGNDSKGKSGSNKN